jgi:hypothetical protein
MSSSPTLRAAESPSIRQTQCHERRLDSGSMFHICSRHGAAQPLPRNPASRNRRGGRGGVPDRAFPWWPPAEVRRPIPVNGLRRTLARSTADGWAAGRQGRARALAGLTDARTTLRVYAGAWAPIGELRRWFRQFSRQTAIPGVARPGMMPACEWSAAVELHRM